MLQNNDNGAYEEFQEINVVLLVSDKQYEEFQETKLDPKLQVVLTMVKKWMATQNYKFPWRQDPTGYSKMKSPLQMDSFSMEHA